jgi:hypothetical protein
MYQILKISCLVVGTLRLRGFMLAKFGAKVIKFHSAPVFGVRGAK